MKHCLAVLVVSFMYLAFVQGTCLTLLDKLEICQYFPNDNKYFWFENNEYWTCKENNLVFDNCTAPKGFFNPVTGECQENDSNSFVYNIEEIEEMCVKQDGIILIGNEAGIFAKCDGNVNAGYNVQAGICHDTEGKPCKAVTGNKECVTE